MQLRQLVLPVSISLAFIAAGCAPKQKVRPDDPVKAPPLTAAAADPSATRGAGSTTSSAEELDGPLSVGPVYFALDSAELTPESREALATFADQLRRRPGQPLIIEGHTCELGTAEYNLALGHKRAKVTRDYLVRLGVPAQSVRITSFGEERPAGDGQDDESLGKNRRSEIVLGGDSLHGSR